MNRLGVLEVNDALMTHFDSMNDMFASVGMVKDGLPKYHKMRSEHIVRDAINHAFDGFIHDTVMDHEQKYHARRIDHRIQIGNTVLAIETDEKAHQSYNDETEKKRYDEFASLFPYKFIFIRFNPDSNKEKSNSKTNLEHKIGHLIQNMKNQMDRIRLGQNVLKIEIIRLFY